MKNILNEAEYKVIRQRLENLQPTAERQWGKMDVAQMLAHCNVPMEQATGKVPFKDESNFISRTLIKWMVLSNIKKGGFGKNLPTVKSFVIVDSKEFEKEKKRLLENLDMLYEKGNQDKLNPHPGFGKFDKDQWGGLMYIHLDHHLKQFSA
jgi:tetrahydromethanopterin S-methyltransferase subunit G